MYWRRRRRDCLAAAVFPGTHVEMSPAYPINIALVPDYCFYLHSKRDTRIGAGQTNDIGMHFFIWAEFPPYILPSLYTLSRRQNKATARNILRRINSGDQRAAMVEEEGDQYIRLRAQELVYRRNLFSKACMPIE